MPFPSGMVRKKKLPTPKPKKKRAPRGTGSIFFDARRKVWKAKVPVGKYPGGATRYVEVSGATQAEVIEKRKDVSPPGADITVAQWCDRWARQSGARPSTRDDVAITIATHIKPALGPIRLADLTAGDVETAVLGWNLGRNTARKNLGQLRTILEGARRAKIVPENVARDTPTPKRKKVKIDPFTPAESNLIVGTTRDLDELAVFAVLATCGMRIGEGLALDVTDFDPVAGSVSITKTYSRRHGTRPPKSENGTRTLRVPRHALPALRLAAGDRRKGPLFATPMGTRLDERQARYRWQQLLKRLGIRYRSVHKLRHSVATIMVARGTDLADVAKYLGDSLKTVVDTYIHPTGADVAAVVEEALDRAAVA